MLNIYTQYIFKYNTENARAHNSLVKTSFYEKRIFQKKKLDFSEPLLYRRKIVLFVYKIRSFLLLRDLVVSRVKCTRGSTETNRVYIYASRLIETSMIIGSQ